MPNTIGTITLEQAHDRKITHKVIGLVGMSEWWVVKVGTREECLEYAREGIVGIFFNPMKAVPLSGKDWGIVGIAPLMMEFGEGYYL